MEYAQGGYMAGPLSVDTTSAQACWYQDYIDRRYGTRWTRVKCHLRAAWRELCAAVREARR